MVSHEGLNSISIPLRTNLDVDDVLEPSDDSTWRPIMRNKITSLEFIILKFLAIF